MTKPKVLRILSIDGGGIRGIIPAMVLSEIEKRTDKKIFQLFDLIVGTSTGGLIALALTTPETNGAPMYTAAKLVNFYKTKGKDIFPYTVWHRIPLIKRLKKYSLEQFEGVARDVFKETRLKDALKPVIIPSYELGSNTSWFFKSCRAQSQTNHDFAMKDVALATSAAPTYFKPHKIVDNGNVVGIFVDGGVYANHPAMCAYAESIAQEECGGVLLVSLGTGEKAPIKIKEKRWGVTYWARRIFQVIFDGINDTVNYQINQLFANAPSNAYYRFQFRLTEKEEDMTDARDENLERLENLASKLIENKNDAEDYLTVHKYPEFKELCKRLKELCEPSNGDNSCA